METETQKQPRTLKEYVIFLITLVKVFALRMKKYIILFAKGFAIGAANVVPGMSGGTMAFILGVYEELILSIKNLLDMQAIKLFFSFKIKAAFNIWPWKFLLALGIGVLTAIFLLAKALETTLDNQPVFLWSFFFGLVLASIFPLLKRVKHWNTATISAVVIGAIFAFLMVDFVPSQPTKTPLAIFLSGVIAIAAMILPGISGSTILILLGQYKHILSSVNDRDIVTLLIFAAGAAVGLITLAQGLSWLFKRYHDITVAIMTGLVVGSLRIIWPWKENPDDLVSNVLPSTWNSEVTIALTLAFFGFALVFALDRWASGKPDASETEIEPAQA